MAVGDLGFARTRLAEGEVFHFFFNGFDQLCIVFGALFDKGKEALRA